MSTYWILAGGAIALAASWFSTRPAGRPGFLGARSQATDDEDEMMDDEFDWDDLA